MNKYKVQNCVTKSAQKGVAALRNRVKKSWCRSCWGSAALFCSPVLLSSLSSPTPRGAVPAGTLRTRARGWARWCVASVLLPAPAHTPAALPAPAALPSCRTKQKKLFKKGQADARAFCCQPVFISTAQERLCWAGRPNGCHPKGQDVAGMSPAAPGGSVPGHLIPVPRWRNALTSPGTPTQLSWPGDLSSQRRSWPTTGRGQIWAALGGRHRSAHPRQRCHRPALIPESGFCLPGDLHSSTLPPNIPNRFPSVGCSLLRPLGDAARHGPRNRPRPCTYPGGAG